MLRRLWNFLRAPAFPDERPPKPYDGDPRNDTERKLDRTKAFFDQPALRDARLIMIDTYSDPKLEQRVTEAADDMHRRTMTLIPGNEPSRILLDAQFLVWRRNMMGFGYPSLDLLDPQMSLDWPQLRQRTIAVQALTEDDRTLTFDEIVAKYPCPTRSAFE